MTYTASSQQLGAAADNLTAARDELTLAALRTAGIVRTDGADDEQAADALVEQVLAAGAYIAASDRLRALIEADAGRAPRERAAPLPRRNGRRARR